MKDCYKNRAHLEGIKVALDALGLLCSNVIRLNVKGKAVKKLVANIRGWVIFFSEEVGSVNIDIFVTADNGSSFSYVCQFVTIRQFIENEDQFIVFEMDSGHDTEYGLKIRVHTR